MVLSKAIFYLLQGGCKCSITNCGNLPWSQCRPQPLNSSLRSCLNCRHPARHVSFPRRIANSEARFVGCIREVGKCTEGAKPGTSQSIPFSPLNCPTCLVYCNASAIYVKGHGSCDLKFRARPRMAVQVMASHGLCVWGLVFVGVGPDVHTSPGEPLRLLTSRKNSTLPNEERPSRSFASCAFIRNLTGTPEIAVKMLPAEDNSCATVSGKVL